MRLSRRAFGLGVALAAPADDLDPRRLTRLGPKAGSLPVLETRVRRWVKAQA